MTVHEAVSRVTPSWLLGIAWRLRRNCECERCSRSLLFLLADTERLMLVVRPENAEARPS